MSMLTPVAAAAAFAIVPFTSIGLATAADLNRTEVVQTAAHQRYGTPVQIAQRRICISGRRCFTPRPGVPRYDPQVRPRPVRDTTPPSIAMFVAEDRGVIVSPVLGPRRKIIALGDRITVLATAADPQSRIYRVSIVGTLGTNCPGSGKSGSAPPRPYRVRILVPRTPVRFVTTAPRTRVATLSIPSGHALRCPDGSRPTRVLYHLTAKATNYAGRTVSTRELKIVVR